MHIVNETRSMLKHLSDSHLIEIIIAENMVSHSQPDLYLQFLVTVVVMTSTYS